MFSVKFSGKSPASLIILTFSPVISLCSPIVNVLLVGPDVTLYNLTLELLPVLPEPTATSVIRIVASLTPVPTFAFVKSTNNLSLDAAPTRYPCITVGGTLSKVSKPNR